MLVLQPQYYLFAKSMSRPTTTHATAHKRRRAPTDSMRIVFALLVLSVSSMASSGGSSGGHARRRTAAASRATRTFFGDSPSRSIREETQPDLVPIGGRRRHASRLSMRNRSCTHTPQSREALRTERLRTAERLQLRTEETRQRRNARNRIRRQERNANMR